MRVCRLDRGVSSRTAAILLLLLVLLSSSAMAVGEPGAQFLKIPVGPKACAMGEAFVAMADDPSAVYWNPAGLTLQPAVRMMGMHASWFADMSYQYVSATIERGYGHFGIGLTYSSSGEMPGRNTEFAPTDDYSAYDACGALSYGRSVTTGIAVGGSLKLIQQKIEEESATGYAADLGALWELPWISGLRCGGAIYNVGPEITFIEAGDPLPLALRLGLAYVAGPVSASLDTHKPRHSEWRLHSGAQYVVKEVLAVRVGFKTRPEFDAALTAGAGVHWRRMWVEYAFVPYEELDDTHRFSFTIDL